MGLLPPDLARLSLIFCGTRGADTGHLTRRGRNAVEQTLAEGDLGTPARRLLDAGGALCLHGAPVGLTTQRTQGGGGRRGVGGGWHGVKLRQVVGWPSVSVGTLAKP